MDSLYIHSDFFSFPGNKSSLYLNSHFERSIRHGVIIRQYLKSVNEILAERHCLVDTSWYTYESIDVRTTTYPFYNITGGGGELLSPMTSWARQAIYWLVFLCLIISSLSFDNLPISIKSHPPFFFTWYRRGCDNIKATNRKEVHAKPSSLVLITRKQRVETV